MARGSYLKKEEYDYIKLLQSKGRKISEIVDTTGRSDKTVRRACKTNDYTNYIEVNHAERKARDEREAEQQKMDIPDLEKDKTLPPPPNFVDVPAYFIDRTDNVICHQIAQVAINAINALLDIHKRRCDHGDSSSDPGVQRVG